MVWTSNPAVAAKNAEILRSAMEVQTLVHRLIMGAVTDVLEEQGRRAGLSAVVISAILNQLSIQARYSPLQCEELVASSGNIQGPKGTCFISDNTVASICDMPPPPGPLVGRQAQQQQPPQPMCTVMQRSTVPVQHRTIFWNSLDHQYNHGKLVDSDVAGRDE
ncbi:hypothetical protein KIN20_031314 [Parelaphostrongylus tenuis]|uniref:Uncharacterized protein n=1 Tax=Parelaphostrongylus tenuis TaxID=148309 RepID=A0AAD5R5C6_PARTN|nr:hypothetical protein KIN20_031314 [Parelaphostrongylus tenuis]